MRMARVMGTVTMSRRLPEFKAGRYLIVEVLDGQALSGLKENARRATPMPESLVVFDELGAGVGQLIGVSEGREATMPFYPDKVPMDAYAAAILDTVQMTEKENHEGAKTPGKTKRTTVKKIRVTKK